MVNKCKMERKTLSELLANPQFIKFIEDLKQCPTVKVIYMVESMVRKGESKRDVDLKIERIKCAAGDKEIYKLISSFPIRGISSHKKKLITIKYFMVGDILINIFWDEMSFNKPFLVLWRNESA